MNEYEGWGLAQWLAHLERSHAHQPIALGLARIRVVAERLEVLHFSCPIVTIAGTNGKGSTVASLAALLLSAEMKVGTYTSPHLLKFNERIQIAGKCVADEQLCTVFQLVRAAQREISLTFFEFTTLAALVLFHHAQLDVILLEVGMGGRLDAVNIIDPQVAIITSLGYDHQAFLGETLSQIGQEKAGILRPEIPALIGRDAQIPSLIGQAENLQSRLYLDGEAFSYQLATSEWHYQESITKIPAHFLPPQSVSLALAGYTILGNSHLKLPPLAQVVGALAGRMMIGRCQELIYQGKRIILDVGHNGQASEWLARRLQILYPQAKKIAVWSSLADKPLSAIVAGLSEVIDTWFVGELPGNVRSSPEKLLKATLLAQGIKRFYSFADMKTAFAQALALTDQEDVVVVFGSFYVVGEIYAQLVGTELLHQNGLFYTQTSLILG